MLVLRGNYEKIQHHKVYNTKDFDYICFTDNSFCIPTNSPWKIININSLFNLIRYVR